MGIGNWVNLVKKAWHIDRSPLIPIEPRIFDAILGATEDLTITATKLGSMLKGDKERHTRTDISMHRDNLDMINDIALNVYRRVKHQLGSRVMNTDMSSMSQGEIINNIIGGSSITVEEAKDLLSKRDAFYKMIDVVNDALNDLDEKGHSTLTKKGTTSGMLNSQLQKLRENAAKFSVVTGHLQSLDLSKSTDSPPSQTR